MSVQKISLIIPSFYPAVIYGGPIFTSLNSAKEIAKLDDTEVYVSTTNANMTSKLDVEVDKFIEFEKDLYIKYYDETVINKFSLSLFFNIYKDIKMSDIVHIQGMFSTPTPISLFWAFVFSKPTLLTPHGTLGKWVMQNGSSMKKWWLKLLIKPFSNRIIWHATAEQEKYEILNHFPNATVEVVPNGVFVNEFKNYNTLGKKEYIKKYTGVEDDNVDKIVISMGRLQKKKGLDILIDSFVDVLKTYPNSYLLIAGPDEGEKDNLLQQIKELNLEKRVFLIGSVEKQNKIDFFANADLFALSSHNENFGIVYLESLATGTPIVASTNTPWEEVIEYDCGKWVDNTKEATSQAIIEVLAKDRGEMHNNSIRLSQEYDWSSVAVKFKKLFKRIG